MIQNKHAEKLHKLDDAAQPHVKILFDKRINAKFLDQHYLRRKENQQKCQDIHAKRLHTTAKQEYKPKYVLQLNPIFLDLLNLQEPINLQVPLDILLNRIVISTTLSENTFIEIFMVLISELSITSFLIMFHLFMDFHFLQLSFNLLT